MQGGGRSVSPSLPFERKKGVINMRKPNKTDILKEIQRMIKKEKSFIEEMRESRNPQVVEMVNKAKGAVDALSDIVLFANRNKR